MNDLKYWLGFNLVKGIGPAKLRALLDFYGDIASAWHGHAETYSSIGIDSRAISALEEGRDKIDLDGYARRVEDAGLTVLTWESEGYPKYLREIPLPPPVLYVAGRLQEADSWALAIVGTRRLTAYGRQVTRELAAGLARNNLTIVSGLARGIDVIAHETALDVGGRTIAVLGSGVDCIYPPEHRRLAKTIIDEDRGAIISEYALGVKPEAKNFPPRNRIISGLTLGTIVVEAGERSGALITAEFALDQNREVFAVPGNITSRASVGTNRLIQQGAMLVTSASEVLEELNLTMAPQQIAVQQVLPESAEEAALLPHLSLQPIHVDELTRASGLPSADVSSTLTLLELKGVVQQVGGMYYVLSREPDPVYDVSASDQ